MHHRKKLLAAGLVGIALVAAAPHAQRMWQASAERDRQARRQLFIELKDREIACLERLVGGGLPKGTDVEAETARCRALAVDPETGAPMVDPG